MLINTKTPDLCQARGYPEKLQFFRNGLHWEKEEDGYLLVTNNNHHFHTCHDCAPNNFPSCGNCYYRDIRGTFDCSCFALVRCWSSPFPAVCLYFLEFCFAIVQSCFYPDFPWPVGFAVWPCHWLSVVLHSQSPA